MPSYARTELLLFKRTGQYLLAYACEIHSSCALFMNKYEITCGQCISAFPDFIIENVIKSATCTKVIDIAFLFYMLILSHCIKHNYGISCLFRFFFLFL